MQLQDDVHYFNHGSDETIAVRLQWHIVAVILSFYYYLFIYTSPSSLLFIVFNYKFLLPCQAAQLAYMMENQLRGAVKEADKEKALKEVAEATAKERGTAVENAEEWARTAERAQALAEQKIVGAESLNSVKDKEITELKVALKASEDNWYNASFTDAENSVELVMFQSRRYGFGKGWMAALVAVGVPEDSPPKNPNQVQNPTEGQDEETKSMRELVQVIDSHVVLIDLEITSDRLECRTKCRSTASYHSAAREC